MHLLVVCAVTTVRYGIRLCMRACVCLCVLWAGRVGGWRLEKNDTVHWTASFKKQVEQGKAAGGGVGDKNDGARCIQVQAGLFAHGRVGLRRTTSRAGVPLPWRPHNVPASACEG